jgi:C6 transcription factor Pro1
MHFLDIIFPLQYPMYKPGLLEGGRGWLLALLLQTKPLRHAALAVSVYHRRTTMLGRMSHQSQVAALVQQENHLEICIKLLNQYANSSCSRARLGTVTTVIQMVFFEVLFY